MYKNIRIKGLETKDAAKYSASKKSEREKLSELKIGGVDVKLAQNCNTPPWKASNHEKWTCIPASPPYQQCKLICTEEAYKLSSSLSRFRCDEQLNDTWIITKGVYCKSELEIFSQLKTFNSMLMFKF